MTTMQHRAHLVTAEVTSPYLACVITFYRDGDRCLWIRWRQMREARNRAYYPSMSPSYMAHPGVVLQHTPIVHVLEYRR
jgi:hypothetical protein